MRQLLRPRVFGPGTGHDTQPPRFDTEDELQGERASRSGREHSRPRDGDAALERDDDRRVREATRVCAQCRVFGSVTAAGDPLTALPLTTTDHQGVVADDRAPPDLGVVVEERACIGMSLPHRAPLGVVTLTKAFSYRAASRGRRRRGPTVLATGRTPGIEQ